MEYTAKEMWSIMATIGVNGLFHLLLGDVAVIFEI